MRARTCLFAMLIFAVSVLTGCAVVRSPVSGFVVTNVQAPVAYGQNGQSEKTGTGCAISILGLVAVGDASINSAMSNGQITNVTSIDHTSLSVLGLYARFCTVVRGN